MFRTTCPFCGTDGQLAVMRGYFFATGMYLTADGFAFADAQQIHTEDELVRCDACGHTLPLADCDADQDA